MLQNAYFLAKIGADTAENERNVAEILPKLATKSELKLKLNYCKRRGGSRLHGRRSRRAALVIQTSRGSVRNVNHIPDGERSDKL